MKIRDCMHLRHPVVTRHIVQVRDIVHSFYIECIQSRTRTQSVQKSAHSAIGAECATHFHERALRLSRTRTQSVQKSAHSAFVNK